ncbi:quinol monooxygenase YgiN [Actinoplanes lutulentus]|uniref:Quinol monooxygenase YgiN n=1 Tax=Actinoplanes lutulentus TaxID=1287878 RepID=A0A327ZNK0_9ACTN|nr:putative quinol monooxygenase [Actinoplanes lutulentus]MBB2943933.1 quinol monooxygenase YgiN [Actinoplanes lutulentus]RAK42834.1 quinol monooxygenase YgiN [Actinoplanes lutulentus]
MPYAVIAHYRCALQDAELVRATLLTMREHTRAEPANLEYVVHADTSDPASFVLYEVYTDRAGFDAHAASPHFAEHIIGVVRPRLLERRVTFAEPL